MILPKLLGMMLLTFILMLAMAATRMIGRYSHHYRQRSLCLHMKHSSQHHHQLVRQLGRHHS